MGFYRDHLDAGVQKLEQGFLALASGLGRFGFKPLDREQSFTALYELINFAKAPAYRPDISLNAQLAHSHYLFRPSEEYLVINGREYVSQVGMKYPPPTSLAMYLRRFYELDFPLLLRQSIGFAPKERLYKHQDFNTPIAQALASVDPRNLRYVDEVRDFRSRIENEKELPIWWHFSIVVRAGDKETLRARRPQVITLLKEIGSFGIPEKRNLKMRELPDHSRRLMEIAEVQGLNYDGSATFPSYKLRPLYQFEFAGYTSEGKAQGQFTVRDRPSWLQELRLIPNYQVPQFWQQ